MSPRLIAEVAMIGFRRLWRGKLELLLVFVVPVVFFTIFAMIFTGGVGSGRTVKIKAALENLDPQGATAVDLVKRLEATDAVRLVDLAAPVDDREDPYDRAYDRVVSGQAVVAVIIPEGWSESVQRGAAEKVLLLFDSSDQVAPKVMNALVQESIGKALAEQPRPEPPPGAPPVAPAPAPPRVESIDVTSDGKSNPVVAMYAAGIAVMFLLFSATGSAGSLLEEEENQTLERLLTSRLSMSHILVGKWAHLAVVGAGQVIVMFAWAQFAFGLDVLGKLDGFLMMTVTTASAAAALALALAAACRTRAQLNAVSVILVLTMSALGGSMVPRYLMSESMQQIGRLTFNAWAIDGYTKIFWRGLPSGALWPEMLVMIASTVVLLIAARLLALRWE